MTEVKFNSQNWYEDYAHRLNDGPLRNQLSAIYGDLIEEIIVETDGTVAVVLQSNVDTRTTAKIDNEELNLHVKFYIRYAARYEVETSLNSEDAAEAERNLQAAIKSGETEFKVPTTLVKKDIINHVFGPWIYASDDDENLVDHMKFSELLENAIDGKAADLGDYSFIKDLVPTLKTERIEFFCKVPEELMISSNSSNQKFHAKDWLNYYNAKLDEDDLKDSFSEEDLSGATSIQFDGEIISADLESNVSDLISVMAVDDETDEEEEYEVEIFADFTYSVDYKMDNLEEYIEDFTRSLNDASDKEESTFEIRVPFVAGKAYDLEVNVTEIYDDEVDEGKVRQAAFEHISDSLDEPTFQMHHGDSIQPPQDKEVTFICTIPAE